MSSKIYTPSGVSQRTTAIATDKVRIAATSAMAIAVGNSAVTANVTDCMIIPAGGIERSLYVGQGNYIAYITIGTAGPFSVTELGSAH